MATRSNIRSCALALVALGGCFADADLEIAVHADSVSVQVCKPVGQGCKTYGPITDSKISIFVDGSDVELDLFGGTAPDAWCTHAVVHLQPPTIHATIDPAATPAWTCDVAAACEAPTACP